MTFPYSNYVSVLVYSMCVSVCDLLVKVALHEERSEVVLKPREEFSQCNFTTKVIGRNLAAVLCYLIQA